MIHHNLRLAGPEHAGRIHHGPLEGCYREAGPDHALLWRHCPAVDQNVLPTPSSSHGCRGQDVNEGIGLPEVEAVGTGCAEVRVHKSGLLPSAQVISVVRCQDDHVLLLWGQAVPRLGLVVGTVGDPDQGATGH